VFGHWLLCKYSYFFIQMPLQVLLACSVKIVFSSSVICFLILFQLISHTRTDTHRVNKCYHLLSSFISVMEKLETRMRWENDVWRYAVALSNAGLGSNWTHRLHFCVYLPVCIVRLYVRYQRFRGFMEHKNVEVQG